MKDVGLVVKDEGKFVSVKVDKKDECSKCGMCLFPKGASSIEIKSKNQVGARVGDVVMIERENDGKLLGAILVFLIPLILIGISVLVGYILLNSQLWSLAIAVLSIICWFAVLALIDKKIKNKINPLANIVEILVKDEKNIINEDTKGELK